MYTINNQFPGPTIEANQGDTIEVTVHNNLDHPQAIHWHGIRQRGTNHMDGVPGISQCPIAPGATFVYRFTLEDEMGTYWYHSHYGNTMADGLSGAFIVHAKNDPWVKGRDYDDERIMFLSDWNDHLSEFMVHRMANYSEGYKGQAIPTQPDAVIINGIGQRECATAQPDGKIGSRIRLRLINPGSHGMIRFSIDQHVLQVIEVDDTPIEPLYLKEIALDPGQRASVVIHLNRGSQFSSFWIRGGLGARCIFGGHFIAGFAVLRYTDFKGEPWSIGSPRTAPWPGLGDGETLCQDIDELWDVKPKVVEKPPATAFSVQQMGTSFGQFVDRKTHEPFVGFGMNSVNFVNMINDPALAKVEDGIPINGSNVATLVYEHDGVGGADVIINQLDVGLAHPFHIHGRPFHILARGTGELTPDKVKDIQVNLVNPLYRDTITIGSRAWALVRIPTDNPGVWPIHCHIGWHLSAGKLGLIVIRPDVVRNFDKPQEWKDLCTGPIDEIGPGRRDMSPNVKNYLPPKARAAHNAEMIEYYAIAKRQEVVASASTSATPAAFSMNRSVFTLVQGGQTLVGSADIPDPTPGPEADPAAVAAYATIVGANAVTNPTLVPAATGVVTVAASGAASGALSGEASSQNPAATLVSLSAAIPIPTGFTAVAPGIKPDDKPEAGSLEAAFNDPGEVPPTVLVSQGNTPAQAAAAAGVHVDGAGGSGGSNSTTTATSNSTEPLASKTPASASATSSPQGDVTAPVESTQPPQAAASSAPPVEAAPSPSPSAPPADGGSNPGDPGFAPN
ncbi:hypothetical protein VHUM_03909 [Vanrija humicola]|uniref:Laccase n=1 Tax=Vanrija humicola TaxID=5417 RepID=A0A7D8UZ67_VANHU|nr:hypothetical protein VHUM_03909 [Vanrija humicola]